MKIPDALKFCHRLRDGAARMTRQQFRNALARGLGSYDAAYADNIFHHFQNNPAAFLAARNPQNQSVELIKVILKITLHDDDFEEAQTREAAMWEDVAKCHGRNL